MRLATLLLACLPLLAAESEADRAAARKLLDRSVELAGAARLEVHVIAMLHAGHAYSRFDKERSVAWLRQAFAATAGMDAGAARDSMQSTIVKALAAVSLEDAASLVRAMAEPAAETAAGPSAADAVVGKLLDEKNFDRAIEVLALIPESAEYLFAAARQVFEKLPADDPRRAIVFGRAHQAYGRRPTGPFPEMLARHWRDVPVAMARAALDSVVNALRALDEETHSAESYVTNQGTIKLGSRQTVEFFRIVAVLRALAPKRCDELLAAYPDLRAAVAKYPEGRLSLKVEESSRATQSQNSSSWSSHASASDDDDNDDPGQMLWSMPFAVIDTAMESMRSGRREGAMKDALASIKTPKDAFALAARQPATALERAAAIEHAGARAEVLARIAESMAEKDPAGAARAVSQAESTLQDMKGASPTFGWVAVARAHRKLKNEKQAWEALERAQAGVVELLRRDTNPEMTNKAPREYWPSTQGGRIVAAVAATLFGARADTLLEGLQDVDLALLERVQMAETLLGILPTSLNVLFNF